jgi:succinate dehydrogenase/fumarate reductase flavoprotein subunit/HEAT repeat protein
MDIPSIDDRLELTCEVLVIGGGTAGTMAAISAAENGADVILMEKAHVRHSGALAMGMDGVNNAVIPGKATPEDYVAEITRANDGIVNQRTVMQTASRGYDMVRRLEGYGVKFEKDEHNEYAVRKVHRSGSYVLPMPEGKDVKKVLYRVLRQRHIREKVRIENRFMPVRVLTSGGRAVGAAGFDTRTGRFVTVRAGAVVLATGACGRLGLPASGYLYGTYENPTNAGDGYAMAYHAGAELSGIECFQVNPLIKDYNGPACAYVANPFGGYQVNAEGDRFVDCDYWSGQMMSEVKREIDSARGPIYLKLKHLPDETLTQLEGILHHTERPTRGTFHANRGHDYRTHDVEMHISEIGLCGGHSSSGVWVDENARTTVPGLYAAGDLACVPHNYMIGAFVFGDLAGTDAAQSHQVSETLPEDQIADAHELIYRPLRNPDGPPQPQVEYKLRRFVNDYVAPPKTARKLEIAIESFTRMEDELEQMGARTPHELMRCAEVSFIRDCAELAARASIAREESRWGLYHERADVPQRDDDAWFFHLNVRRADDGSMELLKRPVNDYLVDLPEFTPPAPIEPGLLAVIRAEDRRPQTPGRAVPQVDDPLQGEVGRSPRLLELLALLEGTPTAAELEPFVVDPDPDVRRSAVSAITEAAPAGATALLVRAFDDAESSVRAAAATALRELVEVLPADETSGTALRGARANGDPVVRAVVLDVLRALELGNEPLFREALGDVDSAVRLQAVRGLVSVDSVPGVALAAGDSAREVRIAVAHGLGRLGGSSAETLLRLAVDDDPLVRAAALEAAAGLGGDPALAALCAKGLTDPAWQVRTGAARGLAAGPGDVAEQALLGALGDAHADVRKAAVISLAPWQHAPDVRDALERMAKDNDADVRGYARRQLLETSR